MVERNSFTSFEEVYKTSYSHGLESIYKLENVDLKTVRKLSDKPERAPSSPKTSVLDQYEPTFDFGVGFRDWITPYLVYEPIEVLNLNRHSEKCLRENGLKTLKDLQDTDLMRFIYIKGMGQGHIDEIKEKLAEYCRGKSFERAYCIDYKSWILTLIADLGAKNAYVILEPFHLHDMISLSPLESVEVRKLTYEKKKEIIQDAREALKKSEKVMRAREQFAEISEAFLRPWIRKRLSLASEDEIEERLERLSPSGKSEHEISFIRSFFDWNWGLPSYKKVYFSESYTKEVYINLDTLLNSYFISQETLFPVPSLFTYIARDLAKKAIPLKEDFFKKSLLFNADYKMYKSEKGELLVKRRKLYSPN